MNNSYELARNYVNEVRNKIESDIVLIAYDLNKIEDIYKSNPNELRRFLITQKNNSRN